MADDGDLDLVEAALEPTEAGKTEDWPTRPALRTSYRNRVEDSHESIRRKISSS